MQFHIRTLLVLMAIVSLLCGVIFAAPPFVAAPLLCLTLWLSPAFWINGIVHGHRAWRAFFIGGATAGLVPHMIGSYYSMMLAGSLLSGPTHSALPDVFYLLDAVALSPNLIFTIIFLGPVVVELLGGLVGAGVYWNCTNRQCAGR